MINTTDNLLTRHMGEQFNRLSPLLRVTHTGKSKLEGTAQVTQGNWIATLLCKLFRFPPAGPDVHLTVICDHTVNSMTWHRNFNGLTMYSHFSRHGYHLIEHLGALALHFNAVEKGGQLEYQFFKTKFLGIPMPSFLTPKINAGELEANGKYTFYVEVSMFLIGPVIAYNGELNVEHLE